MLFFSYFILFVEPTIVRIGRYSPCGPCFGNWPYFSINCCNEILENLTMNNSYPFNTDFQSIELHILKWAQQLETKINNYKGEE